MANIQALRRLLRTGLRHLTRRHSLHMAPFQGLCIRLVQPTADPNNIIWDTDLPRRRSCKRSKMDWANLSDMETFLLQRPLPPG